MTPRATRRRNAPERSALVTGASRGLGAVVARFLGAEGYDLVLVARERGPLESFAGELRSKGATVRTVAADVGSDAGRKLIASTGAFETGLDLLVNNASELGPSPLRPLASVALGDLERVYRTNVIGPIGLVQAFRPALARRSGLVVNISSDAAIGGYPGWGCYGASKAALDLVSLTLAHELASDGIGVVAVDPGDLRTTMHQAAYPGEDISDRPLPEITLPFWAWLLGQSHDALSGRRFRAQAEHWGVPA